MIKEEGGRDRWFDNYGGDFVVPLPEQAMSSSLISPPAGRAGPPPQAPTEGLEEAQLALGGAAAKTYGGGKENASPYAENCVVVASEAVEAAKQASKQAALATAAARDLPEDGVASTKARRLIAQAEQAKAFARAKAAEAELAASRIREINEQLGLNPNPDKTPEALAREKERAAEDVARMASQSWAGEASAEISEDTLRRWRDEMELTVTKEAEQRAAEAEKAARRLFDENKRLEAEREKEAARARADAEAAEAAKAEEAQRLEAGGARPRRRTPRGPPPRRAPPSKPPAAPAPAASTGFRFRRRSRSRRWRPPPRGARPGSACRRPRATAGSS